ncbi:PLP-dependent cysteine synthase family protein [uncultured Microbacterium sp.]|uniref:PLP-dependent cysteine synthase family protein n=1 Tax=uncultured Microbacterium sp. TaxID=191216 RepID=UPI0025D0E913|nr:cysteine synthase family protein [uncultured Microbacterium sp.]
MPCDALTDLAVRAADVLEDAYLPTPTRRLPRLFPGASAQIHAKLDNLQLAGSVKERTAAALLSGLIRDGLLTDGGTVVESTSGNLGIALARHCALLGIDFIAVVDERANEAACQTMTAYGARLDRVATPPDGNRLAARVRRVRELLESIPGGVTTNQYGNPDNPGVHQRTTFPELVDALGHAPTHLYVAMSTTGTLLGVQRAIEEGGHRTLLVGVDVEGSALFGGETGNRLLPGLGAGFETELSRSARPDAVHRIPESEIVLGSRLLARREGILAGASTGAIVAAIGRDLPLLDADAVVAFIVHDTGLPYLPTVFDDGWVHANLGDEGLDPDRLAADDPFAAA